MKFLQTILFLIVTGLLLPCVAGAQNVSIWQEPCDSNDVGKSLRRGTLVYNSGNIVYSSLNMDKTFYPTPQTTFDKQNYYKHYFIGTERICTQKGKFIDHDIANNVIFFLHGNISDFRNGFFTQIYHAIDSVGYSGNTTIDPVFNSIVSMAIFRAVKYYYHYNHQGSVSLVTYQNGTLQQHLQYLPYGGIFVDHRTGSYSSTYTFSAKEKDSESGYTYFGARYYSDGIMQWLSVDPMSDKYPSMSPYMYCAGNPIKLVDPTGSIVEYNSFADWLFVNIAKIFDNTFRLNFKILKNSEETYVFNYNASKSNFSTDGNNLYINYTNNNEIQKDNQTVFSMLRHETTHAVQFEYGELGFAKIGDEWSALFHDIYDEIKAWDNMNSMGRWKSIPESSYDKWLGFDKEQKKEYIMNEYYNKQNSKFIMQNESHNPENKRIKNHIYYMRPYMSRYGKSYINKKDLLDELKYIRPRIKSVFLHIKYGDTVTTYMIYFSGYNETFCYDSIDSIVMFNNYIRVYKNWYLKVPIREKHFVFVKMLINKKTSCLFERLNNNLFDVGCEVNERAIKKYNLLMREDYIMRRIGVSVIQMTFDNPIIKMPKKFQRFIDNHPEYFE